MKNKAIFIWGIIGLIIGIIWTSFLFSVSRPDTIYLTLLWSFIPTIIFISIGVLIGWLIKRKNLILVGGIIGGFYGLVSIAGQVIMIPFLPSWWTFIFIFSNFNGFAGMKGGYSELLSILFNLILWGLVGALIGFIAKKRGVKHRKKISRRRNG